MLDSKDLMFWNLQFQLLEMNVIQLRLLKASLVNSGLYKPNKQTKKFEELGQVEFTEEDRQCLATHLAIQMSGVE